MTGVASQPVEWMATEARNQLADLLAEARTAGRQVQGLPADLVPPTLDDGIRVDALVAERLGWAPLGWKIAATTPETQQRLRAASPLYGRTFARFEATSGGSFARAELLDPLIECEFFFRLGRPLPARAAPYTEDEVAAKVASLHAGIEIAECRFPLDALPPIAAILADGAASGRYVVGAEIDDWRRRDLSRMPVVLKVDGRERRRGSGAEVMGNPLLPLVWLANERARWGDGLAAGALISTGTATGMLLAAAGQSMRARFDGEVAVEVGFT